MIEIGAREVWCQWSLEMGCISSEGSLTWYLSSTVALWQNKASAVTITIVTTPVSSLEMRRLIEAPGI